MKVTLEIKLEGNMVLPIAHEVETLADLKALGGKLSQLPANAEKLMPGTKARKVDAVRVVKD